MTKPIWVFEAGTYRTGSTTHYQMVRDVVQTTNSGIAIGYHNERRLRGFDALDFSDLEAVQAIYKEHYKDRKIACPFTEVPQFSRQAPYIVCKVFEYLPDGFRKGPSHGQLINRQKRLKVVVSIRDPRDIATSMRRREEQRSDDGRKDSKPFDFEELVTQQFPIWLGAVEKWIDLGPDVTLVSKFEDFTQNLEGEARRIAAHLSIEIDDATAQRIAGDYQVDAIRKRKDKFWQKRRKDPDVNEDTALPSIPALLFASSGQWQRELSKEEAKLVYRANRGFFERFGYREE